MKNDIEKAKKYIRLWMFNKYISATDCVDPKLTALSKQVQAQMQQLTQTKMKG